MFPLFPFLCVTFSTLFMYIPDPVQNNALSFGWSSFGVIVHIDLAWLNATYSVPGYSSSVVKSPGSTINCLNWSFMSKPASKPWNLWIVVAQAGTRGQYVTLQHVCFRLQNLVIIVMGTCCTSLERFSGSKEITWKYTQQENHTYLSCRFRTVCPQEFYKIWKIPFTTIHRNFTKFVKFPLPRVVHRTRRILQNL